MNITENLRIESIQPLISPSLLQHELPITEKVSQVVTEAREQANKILDQESQKLLVIVGPCSIHDPQAALEYAGKLKNLADKYSNELLIIMRVYFEKPRTTVGWKGLINDPLLNGSFRINKGLHVARQLLLDINDLGLPVACEFLDTIIPQYLSDLVSWAAIGARTTESQIHRELTSGLSMPVGFKNGTSGDIQIAVDAISAAKKRHHFLSVTKDGIAAIVCTKGNQYSHLILRGSKSGPNYHTESIQECAELLEQNQHRPHVMVDCSHGNCNKDHELQKTVVAAIAEHIAAGQNNIFGIMIESNLVAGKQALSDNLVYGQSITDACIGWEDTETALATLANSIRVRNQKNSGTL